MIAGSRHSLEATVSFWNVFFILLIFIPLIMLWVFALVDLFRRHDLSGWAKALWAIAIVLLPLLGMLIYFITRPPTEEERQATREDAEVSRSASVAEQLTLLSKLKKKGELTEAEYQQEKDRLLAS